jgi:hypothetical protein
MSIETDTSKVIVDVTVEVPQVPYAGIVAAGLNVLDRMDADDIDFRAEAGAAQMTPDQMRAAMAETRRIHAEHGVSDKGLREGMPFAYELVWSGLVHSVAVLAGRDDTVETQTIGPINPAEVETAATFLDEAPNRSLVRRLFTAIKDRVGQSDVTDKLPGYRDGIAAVSQKYAGQDHRDPAVIAAKQGELGAYRGDLMSTVGPAIHEAVAPMAEEHPGVMAFAGAVACAMPDGALFAKHAPKG